MFEAGELGDTEGFYYRPRVDIRRRLAENIRRGWFVVNGHFGTEIASCLEPGKT